MSARPQGRTKGILTEELDRGLVVYDANTAQAHALDPAAARVWSAADGTRTVEEIAVVVGLEPEVVALALSRLGELGLLVKPATVSRRSMLRRTAIVGAIVAAVPVIETVVIPTAAAHASTHSGPNLN